MGMDGDGMANGETNVRSIERATRILDCFTREQPCLSLVEISRMIKLPPSTTFRMVSTLESVGYLRRDDRSLQYSLGYKLARLGSICLTAEGLREIARPYLTGLRDRYNESVGLYVVSKNQRVCIDCVPSTQPLHRVIDIGTRMMMTRGASGKMLLAYQPKAMIHQWLAEDPFVTMDQLEEIQRVGYASSCNEHEQGLTSIAAPIFNAEHNAEAALFLSGPSTRIIEDKIPDIAERVKATAMEISVKLGYDLKAP